MPPTPTAWPAWRPRRPRSSGVLRQVVVDDEGRVVGETRLGMDRARTQPVAQRRRHDLVIDPPADVLGARRAAIAPPGVVLAVGVQRAIRIDPTARLSIDTLQAQAVEPVALGRQAAGVLLVGFP